MAKQLLEGRIAPTEIAGSPSLVSGELRDALWALESEADWDGEGAQAVSGLAIQAAIDFVAAVRLDNPVLPEPDRVSPSVLGAVSLKWHRGDSLLLVEIASKTAPRVYHQWVTPNRPRQIGFEAREVVVKRLHSLYQ